MAASESVLVPNGTNPSGDFRLDTAGEKKAPSAFARWKAANPSLFYAIVGVCAAAVIGGAAVGIYYGVRPSNNNSSSSPTDQQSGSGNSSATLNSFYATYQPHLGTVGNGDVVVMWVTGKADGLDGLKAEYYLAEKEGDSASKKSAAAASTTYNYTQLNMHKAVLTGLEAGKRYKYRVSGAGSNAEKYSAEESFVAPFAAYTASTDATVRNAKWGFLALGDIGTGPTAQGNLALMSKEDFSVMELFVNVGDLAYAYKNDGEWNKYMTMLAPVASKIFMMALPGNHDILPADSGNELGEVYRARFFTANTQSSSTNPHWYSFNHRTAHFITLSTDDDYNPGSPQYTWLEQDLVAANSPANRSIRPWVIVAMHKPMYNSISRIGSSTMRGSPGDLVRKLEPLFEREKVDIVYAGHDHAYERTFPVGSAEATVGNSYVNAPHPVHLLVGMGGYIQLSPAASLAPFSAFREDSYGYSRTTFFNASTLLFEYVEVLSGKVHDSVWISKTV